MEWPSRDDSRMSPVRTIGHGNRSAEEFVGLLVGAGVRRLVDVRAVPVSRRHPQFTREALERALGAAGIGYEWEGPALGGRRRPAPGSPHLALHSPAFRAYADYMSSAAFKGGLERLVGLARAEALAIVCAERLPWQCHRFLVSDALVARGVAVEHLVDERSRVGHQLSPHVRMSHGALVYDRVTQSDLGL